MDAQVREADELQRFAARLIAAGPAGVRLLLIGGFRYRLLDGSHRFSADIDYHWDGDLRQKQQALRNYCNRVVLPEAKRLLGYEASASGRTGPDAESPNSAFLDLRFWKAECAVEIPLEITRIVTLDPPAIRTVHGTIYPTVSDADQIEAKILAVLNRVYLQHRDLVDVFLYGDRLRPDSPARLKQKVSALAIPPGAIRQRLQDLDQHTPYHAAAIQKVIDTQVEPPVAEQMNSGGGGQTVLAESLKTIKRVCPR